LENLTYCILSSAVPLRVRGEPDAGKNFIELNRGMGRQATEDIPEVREAIDVEVLAVPVEESRTAAIRQPRSRPLS
jgi:hypothetical protein